MNRIARLSSRDALAFAGTCALAPVVCLLGFLTYQGYSAFKLESLVAFALIGATAALAAFVATVIGRWAQVLLMAILVTVVLDYLVQWQAHGIPGRIAIPTSFVLALGATWAVRARIPPIFSAAFTATGLAIAIVPLSSGMSSASEIAAPSPPASTQSPAFIHLVLDGYIAPAGLPADVPGASALRDEMVGSLLGHRFRVFERVFSRHPSTRSSITAVLNLEAPPNPGAYVRIGRSGRIIATRNDLYAALVEAGYRVEVTQPDGYDWCSAENAPVHRCRIYTYQKLGWLDRVDLGAWDSSRVIIAAFLNGSTIWFNAVEAYSIDLRGMAPWLPRLPEQVFTYVGIDALDALRALPEHLGSVGRGTALFAHILLPHGPHVFDAECSLRSDLDDWREPERRAGGGELARWRAEYQRYFEQVRCVHRHLDRIMATIDGNPHLRDAVVVLHGDHGSRIAQPRNADDGARSTLVDGLSTLFAVRAPGIAPGRDGEQVGLDRVFAANVLPALGLPPRSTPDGREIFHSSGSASVLAPEKMPDF